MDAGLLVRWMDEGRLPALRRLRADGVCGPLGLPAAMGNDGQWTSFYTGVGPGRHGRGHPSRLREGSYRFAPIDESDARVAPLWERLSDAGRRVVVLDAPKAWLSGGLLGVQLVDWDSHDVEHGGGPRSLPADYAREVVARFGAEPVGPCDAVARSGEALGRLQQGLLRRVEAKTAAALDLLEREAWELALIGFGSPHCAGHQLWHVHDPAHASHDPLLRRRLGDPLETLAVALDAAVARLLAAVPEDTLVALVALPGFADVVSGSQLLDEVLRRLEPEAARPPAPWRALRGLRRALLPRRLPAWLGRVGHAASEATLDRKRRRGFALPFTSRVGAVRCNRVGREPRGRVQAGAGWERWCQEMALEIGALINADTGRPAVRRVLRTAEVHPGSHGDDLPDLLVEWNLDEPILAVCSERIGTVRGAPPTRRTGDHRDRGLFLVRAPGVAPAALADPVPVEAFAPSLAAWLGVALSDADHPPLGWLLGSHHAPERAGA